MTFTETKNIMDAIAELETWAKAVDREYAKEQPNCAKLNRLESYLETARENLFNMASK